MAKILVIDDSSFMRRYLREALEELGFAVDELLPVSPLEVMEKIKAEPPDLVLTDYHPIPTCRWWCSPRCAMPRSTRP
jgi:PleD family two-component response regulator